MIKIIQIQLQLRKDLNIFISISSSPKVNRYTFKFCHKLYLTKRRCISIECLLSSFLPRDKTCGYLKWRTGWNSSLWGRDFLHWCWPKFLSVHKAQYQCSFWARNNTHLISVHTRCQGCKLPYVMTGGGTIMWAINKTSWSSFTEFYSSLWTNQTDDSRV